MQVLHLSFASCILLHSEQQNKERAMKPACFAIAWPFRRKASGFQNSPKQAGIQVEVLYCSLVPLCRVASDLDDESPLRSEILETTSTVIPDPLTSGKVLILAL